MSQTASPPAIPILIVSGEGIANDSFSYLDGHGRSPSLASSTASDASPSFAPRAAVKTPNRRLKRFRQSLQLRIPEQSPISKVHTAWSRAVNSRIGRTENARFLEHFRYVIVASQLLNEYPDLGSLHTAGVEGKTSTAADIHPDLDGQAIDLAGVLITIGVAFAIVLVVKWALGARMSKSKLLFALACLAVTALLFYAHLRRQWLKRLRLQAVTSVSDLTTNVRGFELTSTAVLSLIQEVELVSKGYRL